MQHPLAGCQYPISLHLIPPSLEPPFPPRPQRPQARQAWLIFYQWREVACPCFGAQPWSSALNTWAQTPRLAPGAEADSPCPCASALFPGGPGGPQPHLALSQAVHEQPVSLLLPPSHSHKYSLSTYYVQGAVPELGCWHGLQSMIRLWLWP